MRNGTLAKAVDEGDEAVRFESATDGDMGWCMKDTGLWRWGSEMERPTDKDAVADAKLTLPLIAGQKVVAGNGITGVVTKRVLNGGSGAGPVVKVDFAAGEDWWMEQGTGEYDGEQGQICDWHLVSDAPDYDPERPLVDLVAPIYFVANGEEAEVWNLDERIVGIQMGHGCFGDVGMRTGLEHLDYLSRGGDGHTIVVDQHGYAIEDPTVHVVRN